MATRLDHLEMVLERRWYDCSNCRRLPRSDRSALVGGCIETTTGVENEGQAVKPAWHCAAARHIGRTQIDTPKIRTVARHGAVLWRCSTTDEVCHSTL